MLEKVLTINFCQSIFLAQMKAQEIFDIAFSVHLAGLENEYQLVRTFFMRSGIKLSYKEIVAFYKEVLRVVNSMGYSEPLDFLKDFFPNENFRKIKIFKKNINKRIKVENSQTQTEIDLGESKIESKQVQQQSQDEPKRIKIQSPKNETLEKDLSTKPIKTLKNVFEEGGSPIEIAQRDKSKISKYKKTSRRFKEMDQREKEIDNRLDYFMHRSKLDEKGQKFVDNREFLGENPFSRSFFDDLDLEFRDVMFRIYKFNRTQTKDKTKFLGEIEFLEGYFNRKLNIIKKDEESLKKLSNAVAYLMKKLQNKIFESEESGMVELLLYFKSKLNTFYNFYRK